MFVILRSYAGTYYLYDAGGTNDFFELDERSYSALKDAAGRLAGCADENIRAELGKNGISDEILPVISTRDFIEPLKTMSLEKLILNLTNRCNMRCKYCVYSGNYKTERSHALKGGDLTKESARKTLDHYLGNGRSVRYICLYGGEPLLNYPVLKYVVKRVQEESPKTKMSVTSNALLMNDPEILDFLMSNDLSLNISFDGPQQETARVDTAGRGTFSRVLGVLQNIHDKSREYFKKNVCLNITLTPMHSIHEIRNYFDNTPLFAECEIHTIFNSDPGDIYVNKYRLEKNHDAVAHEMTQFRHEFAANYPDVSPFLRSLFIRQMNRINRRYMGRVPQIMLHACCIPTVHSVFIDSDGRQCLCEKAQGITFGTVDDFSVVNENVERIVEDYRRIVDKYCKECWAHRLCGHCFATIGTIDKTRLTDELFRCECDRMRSDLISQLELFLSVKERNEEAFDDLEGMDLDPNI